MKVGILTDYPTLSVQSGPALHTRFLHDGLSDRGHSVTLMGPDTTQDTADDSVSTFLFDGVPFPSHPRTRVIVPKPLNQLPKAPRLDVIHGQSANHVIEYANWMRKMYRTAVLNTHIIHLPTHSHFLLGDKLYENPIVREALRQSATSVERDFARMYNEGDCMIVQSRFMVEYWRERGVTVPIEVVGRPIDPSKFSAPALTDPFPTPFAPGHRLVVVCRLDREKNLEALIDLFDRHIAPSNDKASLTIIGGGPIREELEAQAGRGRHADRVYFAGEVPHARLVDWYTHADAFVYTSLSETFGNVINEALWSGLPVVALNDRMGVAHQVVDGVNGYLIEPHRIDTESRFARVALDLLKHRGHRREMGEKAATLSRRVSHPDVVISRFETIYEAAVKRVHEQIETPLVERSRLMQRAALAKHVASWARWNYLALAVSKASFRVGLGRPVHDATPPPSSQPVVPEDRIRPAFRRTVMDPSVDAAE
jgi:glycosyltransferase involved in cell wall biosynthesis